MRVPRCLFRICAAVALSACASGSAASRAPSLTWGVAELSRVGVIERDGLTESSGLARSSTLDGAFWMIEDSGNEPVLYAIDSTGRDLGSVAVNGATNLDWEAIAAGPCDGDRCLYMGDVGDNLEIRPSRTIYRVREPLPDDSAGPRDRAASRSDTTPRFSGGREAERLTFRYEDRPHDVEAMVVSGDGAVHLITKGRRDGILHFRIPPEAWSTGPGGVAVAVRMDSLHIEPPTSADRVTDASLAPDGTLAVRSARTVYMFRMDPETGRLTSPVPHLACDITAAAEPQGEAIAWMAGGALLLTSERRGAPVTRLECL